MNPIRYSKILIVDDSKAFRIKTKMFLSHSNVGMNYYEAEDGRGAIAQYIAHKPHVTIMDINMPDVDGVKATRAIMRYDPNARIIITSTRDNKVTIDDVVNTWGAKDHLIKPYDLSLLVSTVSKQLVEYRKSCTCYII